jgi:hypothetical protein
MAGKQTVHLAGGALSRRVSGHWQSIFRDLAKELHEDPAVLSRGLGKL